MPKARAPNAPCVLVWLSPQTMVMPGCVAPSSGLMTCTIPRRASRMPNSSTPKSAALRPVKRGPSQASQEWTKISGIRRDYFRAQPFFAAQAGKHEFDGQLPDVSEHGIKREIARLHDAREQLAAVDPATLEPSERFDRDYLLTVVDKDLFWLEKARYPFSNPYWYIDNLDPDMYLTRNYAPLDVRMKAYIKYARGIPKMASDIQANLKSPLAEDLCRVGHRRVRRSCRLLQEGRRGGVRFGQRSRSAEAVDRCGHAAAQAMSNLKDYLIGERKTANDKFALGKDLFAQMVKDTERVDLPVEQIEAAGRADLERNTAGAQDRVRDLFAEGHADRMRGEDGRQEAAGGHRSKRRASNWCCSRNSSRRTTWSASRATIRHWWRRRRPTIGPTRRSSRCRDPTITGVAATYNIAPPDPKWTKAEQAAYIPSEAEPAVHLGA